MSILMIVTMLAEWDIHDDGNDAVRMEMGDGMEVIRSIRKR